DRLAGAAAAWARTGRDHLAEDRLPHAPHLTGAAALRARRRRRAGLRAGGVARGARHRQPDRHLLGDAEHRLLERQVDGQLEVRPARRAGRTRRTTCTPEGSATAEERVEDVTEPGAGERVE